MLNQQTLGLNDNVKKRGCKYLCHVRIAEYEASNIIKTHQVNTNYHDHKKFGWVKNECDVFKPNEIMADFIQDLGGSSCVIPRQIGRINGDGLVHFWGGKQTRAVKYFLVEYKTENGFHWVLCDNLMNELYDSWTLGYNRKHINSINLIG